MTNVKIASLFCNLTTDLSSHSLFFLLLFPINFSYWGLIYPLYCLTIYFLIPKNIRSPRDSYPLQSKLNIWATLLKGWEKLREDPKESRSKAHSWICSWNHRALGLEGTLAIMWQNSCIQQMLKQKHEDVGIKELVMAEPRWESRSWGTHAWPVSTASWCHPCYSRVWQSLQTSVKAENNHILTKSTYICEVSLPC